MYVPPGMFFVLFPCRVCVHELSKPRPGCMRRQLLSRKSGVRFCRRQIKAKTARGVAHTLPVHVCIMPPRNIPLIVQTTQVHKDTPHLPGNACTRARLCVYKTPLLAFTVVISKRHRREHARRIVGMRWQPNFARNCAGGGENMRARRRRKIGRFS
jgi:hypothetical protein